MVGTWPIEVKDHGTGYDAWVLDGRGRAAIGPAEFGIRRRDECNDDEYDGDGESESESDRTRTTSGLLKFNKGTAASRDSSNRCRRRRTNARQRRSDERNARRAERYSYREGIRDKVDS
ncbi:hypothetical protein ACHAW5_008738 [Stephanodiscus triporus]|uniref:Uncharacterized protein n=1 Tax=Stephanodiscus triporus TaxID=2934178 RepID=A0ABD3MRF3_9STRA